MSTSRHNERLVDKQYTCQRCPDTKFGRLPRGKSQSHWKYSLEHHVKTEHFDVGENEWMDLKGGLEPVPRERVKARERERNSAPSMINPSANMSEAARNTQMPALGAPDLTIRDASIGTEDADIQQDATEPCHSPATASLARFDVEALYGYHGPDFQVMALAAFTNDSAAPVYNSATADEGSINMVRYHQAKSATLEAHSIGWQQGYEVLIVSNMEKDNEIRALQAIRAQLLAALEARGMRL